MFERFFALLEHTGLDSELAVRFIKVWRRRTDLPPWENVFSVVEPEGGRVSGSRASAIYYSSASAQGTPEEALRAQRAAITNIEVELANAQEAPDYAMDIDSIVVQQDEGVDDRANAPLSPQADRLNANTDTAMQVQDGAHLHVPLPPPRPPQLFNPLRDGGPPCYTRHVCGNYIVYKHATAGAIVPNVPESEPPWRRLRREIKENYEGNKFGIWGSQRNWEDARWFTTANQSQAKLEELLGTARYREDPPSFGTAKNLFRIVEKLEGVGGPDWGSAGVRLPEAYLDEEKLYYRCPVQCGSKLLGMARLADNISFAPELVYELDDATRVYSNLWNGDDWCRIQETLPQGATRGAAIFMSDATILSKHTGGVQVHALYMSLGNIDKSIREDISKGAWMLVAFIPKSNFEKTMATMNHLSKAEKTTLVNLLNRRLFHRCLEIITRPFRSPRPHDVLDPEGNTRSVVFDLAVYGADLEEQCTLTGVERNSCPHCASKGEALGKFECQCPRSSEQIKQDIKTVLANFHSLYHRHPDPLEFLKRAKKFGLNGVHKPFWRKLPNFDICRVLSPDLLHGYHKFYYDHIHKWNLTGLGADEYDARLRAQIPIPGERMFPRGVSTLKQLAGKDHRGLERVGVALVAHAPNQSEGGAGSNELTRATRALLDCIFLAQYPVHTEKTLAKYEASYKEFHQHKHVWIKNKSKRKKGKGSKIIVNESWAIPKPHIMRHAPEHIRAKGTLDNYNTETMEHLHRSHCKDPYDLTNHQRWQDQILRRLSRYEKIREYGEFLVWHQELTWEEQQNAAPENENGQVAGNALRIEDGDDDEEGDEDNEDRDDGEGGEEVNSRVRSENMAAGGQAHENAGVSAPRTLESFQRNSITLATNHVEPGNYRVPAMGPQPARGWRTRLPYHTRRPSPLLTSIETYAISKRPTFSSVTIEQLLLDVDVPNFLYDVVQHPYFANLRRSINHLTEFHLWNSFRVRIPTSCFAPEPRLARIYAVSGLVERGMSTRKLASMPRSDAVFYLPRDDPNFNHSTAKLHDYRVGRLALIFSLAPTTEVPEPRLMGYIERFTAISKRPSGSSGFHAVAKSKVLGHTRYECVFLDQVIRPCPLAPIIVGAAERNVEGHNSLSHYDSFYINKYRHPRDYAWLHQA